jgi:hypothetical protein
LRHRIKVNATKATVNNRKIQLETVSLVCVDTRRLRLAVVALQRCLQRIDFKECLLLGTGAASTPLPSPIRYVTIPPITNVADYSQFMLKEFGNYFTGSHALIAQWDGFVTHPECWDPRFLDYDYIGAPWPALGGAVGNGGFSLRSRRLTDALRQVHIQEAQPEDYCICISHRAQLETRFGIRFAPTDVARRFSWEAVEPPEPTFGMHGFFNFHRTLGERGLMNYFDLCDSDLLRTVEARRLLKHLYQTKMLHAARKLSTHRMQGPLSMRLDALKLRFIARLRRSVGAH